MRLNDFMSLCTRQETGRATYSRLILHCKSDQQQVSEATCSLHLSSRSSQHSDTVSHRKPFVRCYSNLAVKAAVQTHFLRNQPNESPTCLVSNLLAPKSQRRPRPHLPKFARYIQLGVSNARLPRSRMKPSLCKDTVLQQGEQASSSNRILEARTMRSLPLGAEQPSCRLYPSLAGAREQDDEPEVTL